MSGCTSGVVWCGVVRFGSVILMHHILLGKVACACFID